MYECVLVRGFSNTEPVELTCFDDKVNRFDTFVEKIIMCIKCNKEEAYTYAQKRKKK